MTTTMTSKRTMQNHSSRKNPSAGQSQSERGRVTLNSDMSDVSRDLYYVPDTIRPVYFLSDREDSQAEFSMPPNMAETSVNAFV